MVLTDDQVRHVAKLSRLALTDEQLQRFGGQLSDILKHMEDLNEIDVEGVEPTFQVAGGLVNVQRKDEVHPFTDDPASLLECSPLPVQDDQIRVKHVFSS